eukprot:scaffold19252_cov117-Isochrysis_galbana.AAC.6
MLEAEGGGRRRSRAARKVPLAHVDGGVADGAEQGGHGHLVLRQVHVARLLREEVVHARAVRGSPGQEGGARRRAIGRASVRGQKPNRGLAETVDVRRVQQRVAEDACIRSAGIVQQDKQHVRPSRRAVV